MRKVTFPHMGEMWIPAKTFFQELGLDVILPPKTSKKTLNLGVKYSPEFACLPFKINLGNFIEAIDLGADTIIMGGGCGPCRFGYYGELQREILHELGYDNEMLILEPYLLQDLLNAHKLFKGLHWHKIGKAGLLAWKKILAMDEIHKLALRCRAAEKEEGIVNKLQQEFWQKLDRACSISTINSLKKEYIELILDKKGDFKRNIEIKIGIVGEIYMVLESFVNLEIERKLGQLGAVVEKEIYISNWIYHFLHLTNEMTLINRAAYPYLKNFVGGHGINSVGDAVRFAKKGIDGIIQVGPFTCMPEVIAQTILPEVSKKEEVPVLTLFLDEHSGEAGLLTRLEAFVDLLIRKKELKKGMIAYG